MPRVIRHDAITLNSGVREEDFERFMTGELFPFFSEHYKGPTRASIADLKEQALLRSAQAPRDYLWVTKWEGSQESVLGSSFEHVRMVNVEATGEMLKKLEPFGKRKKEHVFAELADVAVATNT
jgi:hypothetical protein